MGPLRLYLKSIAMNMRIRMQYPLSFFMQTLAQLVMEGGEMLAVILIVDRFDTLDRWSGGDLYFFFGMMSVTFYLTEFLGRGVTGTFPSIVRSGRLDTLLLRPRGVLTQVLCSDADPRRIVCIAVGIAARCMGSTASHVRWTFIKALAVGEAILSGMLLILGLFLIEAVFCIFSVKSVELVNALTYGGRSACQYPVDIFPRPLKTLFTAAVPFALTLQMPAAYVLDKPLFPWPAWTVFACPLSGAAVFFAMAAVFHKALKRYRSTGS